MSAEKTDLSAEELAFGNEVVALSGELLTIIAAKEPDDLVLAFALVDMLIAVITKHAECDPDYCSAATPREALAEVLDALNNHPDIIKYCRGN